jgi:hypothetical protein
VFIPITGRCLCGDVQYKSEAPAKGSFVCHCTDCQKQTGTAFSVVVTVPEAAFTVSGETLVSYQTTGDDSGRPVHRHFCCRCGSPLFSIADHYPGSVFIKAGTLDDTSWLDPTYHIWTSSAQRWVHIDESAVTSERS